MAGVGVVFSNQLEVAGPMALWGSAAIVAGAVAPLVMHSTRLLAVTYLLMMGVGLVAWIYVHRRWPDTGRTVTASA